jgi:glycosyltransferase involved in cell wall biosynthesis
MRIGIFSESYEPVVNGVTVSILTLTRELKKLGHEIYVFAPGVRGHTEEENPTTRFPSVRTWKAKDYPIAIPYLPRLKQQVKRLNLDVIHTHTPFILGRLGLRLAKQLDIPFVSTNHTQYVHYAHYFPFAPKAATRRMIVKYMKWYYNQCDGIIVPSKPILTTLRSYGVESPIHVIPTGIALDTSVSDGARSAIRGRYGIPHDAKVLVYVGRLAREKNMDLLFESFNRLARGRKDAYLMLIGDGPYESGCRGLCRDRQLDGRVIFVGPVAIRDVAKYYLAGDVFTFPSVSDTQGLVLWEALQAGLPCVAVRAGGAPEMLVDGEDSLLAENSAQDFAAKVNLLLTDDAMRRRFSEKAMENGCRFHPSEMAARVEAVYESVLG